MNLNCDSDLLSVIDRSGALRVIQINSKSDESNNFNTTVLDIDKKDVWDFKWATDSPSMFAIMEKTRLVVFNGLEAEEAIPSPGCNEFI